LLRIITAVVVLVGGAIIALATPPTAASDPSSLTPSIPMYLDDLTKAGINYGTDNGAVADGNQICNAIASGDDFATVEQIAMNITGLDLRNAAQVIVASSLYLCPAVDDHGIWDKAFDLADPN
jgi:hypothetical protein